MITINGVVTHPTSVSYGIEDISKAERNTNGYLLLERVATKRKLELSWSALPASTVSTLFSAVSGVSYNVTFYDPETGGEVTKEMYAGGRSAEMLYYRNSTPYWKNVKFSLIER